MKEFNPFKEKGNQNNKTSNHQKNSKMPKEITHEAILKLFERCGDIRFEKKVYRHETISIHIVQCEGLVDPEKVNNVILPELNQIFDQYSIHKNTIEIIIQNSSLPQATKLTDVKDMEKFIFKGHLLLYFDELDIAFTINVAKLPQRNIEEPNTEVSIKGPRDGFIEDISINIALTRKRLKTNTLHMENFCIGSRTQTEIVLLYIRDIINEDTLKSIKDKIESIPKIDALFSLYHLQDLLTETKYKLVPIFNYTGRPDFVAQSLLQGRFAIFMDGVPTVLIAPVSLAYLTKSSEDNEFITLYVAFTHLLRFLGLFLATFLPGFWVALITFHQEQLPFIMLSTLAETRRGVPFPSPLEAILMFGMFELFREAGMRLPSTIGQTLTVVGGLIIGQAAIQAGVSNPAMVVIMATSLVATFTLLDQSLIGSTTVARAFILVSSAFLGLYGVICMSFIVLIYLSGIKSFNVPLLSPFSPLTVRDFIISYFSVSWSKRNTRSKVLKTNDTDKSRHK